MSKTVKKENEGFGYALKCIALQSAKCMHPRELKKLFQDKKERSLYFVSVPVNPVLLYFLTHNPYFYMKINIKLYIFAAVFGYFLEKGTVKAFQANREAVGGKVVSLKNRHIVNKHEKQLCDVLKGMNIPHHVIKTVSNDFATQIYILSDVQIKTLLSSEREIAKRMHLENKNLTITVDKSYFVFDIRNSLQKVYYFDEYLKKVKEQQLKEKELPFLLGIRQSTGEFIIEDLADMLSSLVAGARGNGKSVFVNVLIQSLMSLSTKEIIFVLADFKGNECIQYKDFKNCLFISSHDKFINILNELIKEMELRYKKLGKLKNLKDYNENAVEKLPYIVVIIDEMACISLCDEKLSESINLKLMDLLNRGRASGIIIIGAMQRPSSKQIDTNVRANLDAKISFRVSDKKETSFTETPGAEKLNRGEFIINAIGYDCERIQSLFIDDKERNFIFEKLEKKFGKGGKKDGFILNLDK
jgi:hypothetical protein